jgi:hypothetical protein
MDGGHREDEAREEEETFLQLEHSGNLVVEPVGKLGGRTTRDSGGNYS